MHFPVKHSWNIFSNFSSFVFCYTLTKFLVLPLQHQGGVVDTILNPLLTIFHNNTIKLLMQETKHVSNNHFDE